MVVMMLLAIVVMAGAASAEEVVLLQDTDSFDGLPGGIWTYGNPETTTVHSNKFIPKINGIYTPDGDGRVAILVAGSNMVIETKEATDSFYIVFASDKNDGKAQVSVDGKCVWSGNTKADVCLGKPIDAQKIRTLKITGLENKVHTIKITNCEGILFWNHVTIYKYGYMQPAVPEQPDQPDQPELPDQPENPDQPEQPDQPENPQEIPEFPTVALPVAAILGLAFFMQRRKEE